MLPSFERATPPGPLTHHQPVRADIQATQEKLVMNPCERPLALHPMITRPTSTCFTDRLPRSHYPGGGFHPLRCP